jgi:hypothetical protein
MDMMGIPHLISNFDDEQPFFSFPSLSELKRFSNDFFSFRIKAGYIEGIRKLSVNMGVSTTKYFSQVPMTL